MWDYHLWTQINRKSYRLKSRNQKSYCDNISLAFKIARTVLLLSIRAIGLVSTLISWEICLSKGFLQISHSALMKAVVWSVASALTSVLQTISKADSASNQLGCTQTNVSRVLHVITIVHIMQSNTAARRAIKGNIIINKTSINNRFYNMKKPRTHHFSTGYNCICMGCKNFKWAFQCYSIRWNDTLGYRTWRRTCIMVHS